MSGITATEITKIFDHSGHFFKSRRNSGRLNGRQKIRVRTIVTNPERRGSFKLSRFVNMLPRYTRKKMANNLKKISFNKENAS
jgi:hypothetical protein